MHDEQGHRLPGDRDPADQHQPAQADPVEGRPAARATAIPAPSRPAPPSWISATVDPSLGVSIVVLRLLSQPVSSPGHRRATTAILLCCVSCNALAALMSALAGCPILRHIPAMPEPVILVENLVKRYGRTVAVDGIGFTRRARRHRGAARRQRRRQDDDPVDPPRAPACRAPARSGCSARTSCGIAIGCCRG